MESIHCVGRCCRTNFIRTGEFDRVRRTSADDGFMGIDFCDSGGLCAEEHEPCSCEGGDGVGVLETVAL